jgi:hypothetical protein
MKAWLATTAGKAIAALCVVALLAGLFALNRCQAARTAGTEAKLATGQAGAAIQSGHDATTTIGNRMETDAATDTVTRENNDAIRNAEGASAPVAAPVRDAGLASLCRRAAYRSDPKCVQYAHTR